MVNYTQRFDKLRVITAYHRYRSLIGCRHKPLRQELRPGQIHIQALHPCLCKHNCIILALMQFSQTGVNIPAEITNFNIQTASHQLRTPACG